VSGVLKRRRKTILWWAALPGKDRRVHNGSINYCRMLFHLVRSVITPCGGEGLVEVTVCLVPRK